MQSTVVKVLVTTLKDNEAYKLHLNAYMVPLNERIAAEFSANVQSVTIERRHSITHII